MSTAYTKSKKSFLDLGIFPELLKLMKPRVMSLVIFTCAVGLLTAPNSVTFTTSALGILIVAIGAGAAGALNMWYEADVDKLMTRTCLRPIPRGSLEKNQALYFGTALSILSVISLYYFTNLLSASLLLFTILFYVFIYTIWLKRTSPQNIVIGGIAGSTPPLIGWAAAAAGTIESMNPLDLGSPIPWMLFALIFLWTPPHFWALALYRSGEYADAKVPMMNEVKGAEHTLFQSKIYCVLLFLLGSVPCFWPESGLPLLWAFMSGGLTFWYSKSVWEIDPNEPMDENGRMPKAAKSFFRSLYYLGWMFLSLVIVTIIPPEMLGFFGPLDI